MRCFQPLREALPDECRPGSLSGAGNGAVNAEKIIDSLRRGRRLIDKARFPSTQEQ